MLPRKWILASALALVLWFSTINEAGGTKPQPPPAGPTLLAMTDNSPIGGAVAISQDGGIVGQSKIWRRVGTTPSAPADIWTRPSTGEVFITLANGDLYRLESNWALTYDSNVFTSQ